MGQKQPLPGHDPDRDDDDHRRVSAHEQWFLRTLNADAVPMAKEIQAFLDEQPQLGAILADYYGRQASHAMEEYLEQGSPSVPEPVGPMDEHAIFSFSLPERLPGNTEDHWVHRDELGKFLFTILALQALIELGVDMNKDAVNTFFDRLEKMNETQLSAIRGDIGGVQSRLDSINEKVSGIDKTTAIIDTKVEGLDAKISSLEPKLATREHVSAEVATSKLTMFMWALGTALTAGGVAAGIVLGIARLLAH